MCIAMKSTRHLVQLPKNSPHQENGLRYKQLRSTKFVVRDGHKERKTERKTERKQGR